LVLSTDSDIFALLKHATGKLLSPSLPPESPSR
jgi:hypothetical protein